MNPYRWTPEDTAIIGDVGKEHMVWQELQLNAAEGDYAVILFSTISGVFKSDLNDTNLAKSIRHNIAFHKADDYE